MKKVLVVGLLCAVAGVIGYYKGTGDLQVTSKSVSVK